VRAISAEQCCHNRNVRQLGFWPRCISICEDDDDVWSWALCISSAQANPEVGPARPDQLCVFGLSNAVHGLNGGINGKHGHTCARYSESSNRPIDFAEGPLQ